MREKVVKEGIKLQSKERSFVMLPLYVVVVNKKTAIISTSTLKKKDRKSQFKASITHFHCPVKRGTFSWAINLLLLQISPNRTHTHSFCMWENQHLHTKRRRRHARLIANGLLDCQQTKKDGLLLERKSEKVKGNSWTSIFTLLCPSSQCHSQNLVSGDCLFITSVSC